MSRLTRCAALTISVLLLFLQFPNAAGAQARAVPRHPPHAAPPVAVHGHVFVGGYFYDPFYGPYPWWPRFGYPYWYYPVFDDRADVKLRVTPEEAEQAAVYIDGFYAGIVDDFNGTFEGLPVTPGGHRIVLYLEGYRTISQHVYLRAASTFKLRGTMEKLPAGVTSEKPEVAPPVPAPPEGSYRTPLTPPRRPVPPDAYAVPAAVGFGTLDLFVRPANAEVTIDGERWNTSDAGHFVVQVPAGRHSIVITSAGYRQFATELQIGEGETRPLNVSLAASTD